MTEHAGQIRALRWPDRRLKPVLTGLLYAAVIAMWAVVLLPRWLRTSDKYRDSCPLSASAVPRNRSLPGVIALPRCGGDARRPFRPGGYRPADAAIDRHLDLGIDPFVGQPKTAIAAAHGSRMPDSGPRRLPRSAGGGLSPVSAHRRRCSSSGAVVGLTSIAWAAISSLALAGYVYRASWPVASASPGCRGQAARAGGPGSLRCSSESRSTGSGARPRTVPHAGTTRDGRATGDRRGRERPWTAERMLEQAAGAARRGDVDSELALTNTPTHRSTRPPGRSTSRRLLPLNERGAVAQSGSAPRLQRGVRGSEIPQLHPRGSCSPGGRSHALSGFEGCVRATGSSCLDPPPRLTPWGGWHRLRRCCRCDSTDCDVRALVRARFRQHCRNRRRVQQTTQSAGLSRTATQVVCHPQLPRPVHG